MPHDPEPGDIYIRGNEVWRVQSVCRDPTMTMERLRANNEPLADGGRPILSGAIGCLLFENMEWIEVKS